MVENEIGLFHRQITITKGLGCRPIHLFSSFIWGELDGEPSLWCINNLLLLVCWLGWTGSFEADPLRLPLCCRSDDGITIDRTFRSDFQPVILGKGF